MLLRRETTFHSLFSLFLSLHLTPCYYINLKVTTRKVPLYNLLRYVYDDKANSQSAPISSKQSRAKFNLKSLQITHTRTTYKNLLGMKQVF